MSKPEERFLPALNFTKRNSKTSNDAFGFYKPLMFLYILKHSQDAFPICGKVAQQEVQVELSTALADFQMQLSVHVQTMKSDM